MTPRVLLLGDSIRMSYQPRVTEYLAGAAAVVGPAENCQFSLYTLTQLDRWLAELGPPAVVHWNNGLHDCGHNPSRDPVQYPVAAYVDNLSHILRRLQQETGSIIWATMTPAHPQRPFVADAWSWRNEEIQAYNEAARELMAAEGIPVNDLHALIWSDMDTLLSADQLHLSPAGVDACAEVVAGAIRGQLDGD